MSKATGLVGSLLARYLGKLRFPQLFGLVALVFLVDLAVPDLVPFADELLLGAGTLLLGSLKKRAEERSPEQADDGPA